MQSVNSNIPKTNTVCDSVSSAADVHIRRVSSWMKRRKVHTKNDRFPSKKVPIDYELHLQLIPQYFILPRFASDQRAVSPCCQCSATWAEQIRSRPFLHRPHQPQYTSQIPACTRAYIIRDRIRNKLSRACWRTSSSICVYDLLDTPFVCTLLQSCTPPLTWEDHLKFRK